jgi:hypothetical protein
MRTPVLFRGQLPSFVAGLAGAALVLVVAAAVFVSVGVGFADDGATIDGCVGRSGSLRVVDSPSECRPSESHIWWNQEGPIGPPGPATTFTRRTEHGIIESANWQGVEAYCLPGEVVTGGGYSLGSIGFNDKVNSDGPITVDGNDGWIVSVHNDTEFDIDLWVTAICAASPTLP